MKKQADAGGFNPNNPHPLSTLRTELVWEGKYDEYGNRREVDVDGCAMPLQRIETVDEPRARAEAQGGLFDTQKSHLDDFRNMLIWGDNKLVMSSLMKDFKGKVDLIYIDPPFDVGADFTMNVGIGDQKETVAKDQSLIEMVAYRDMWGKGTDSYLHMLYERLVVMRELLADDGTLYLHVGWGVSHYVKAVLDDVFGSKRFINQVVWKRQTAHSDISQGSKHMGRIHDVILVYSKGESFSWNMQYQPYGDDYINNFYQHVEEGTGRRYTLSDTTAPGGASKGNPQYEFLGVTRYWRFSEERMRDLHEQGRIIQTKPSTVPRQKRYLDEMPGIPLQDLWLDINTVQPQAAELIGYDTQKPEKLLERIIQLSSDAGDLVADFFCGSGTTGVVAERLGRRWIMADIGHFAIHTSRKRLIDLQRSLHNQGAAYRAFDVHNLGRYERKKGGSREPETYDWMGPKVSKTSALDTSEALRQRISSHPRLMVLNDEAHHVWDADNAWNEAIGFLQETVRKRGGGLVSQLDFSATPRDDKGNIFRHVVCDTPLGEAVDAGIVKTPIIGHGEELVERAHEDAAYKYENHLTLGYKRWLKSKQEWEQSGKKALLFVMTENTDAADQIARRLNSDPAYSELNDKTINLHTNLKGKLKKRGRGATAYYEFIESEKDINDEDSRQLRKLSRELDNNTSRYSCIVSVLMLREGWDVRNVTTIIPLRPLTAKSKILPEQTLGRGLRRMTPPGKNEAAELVAVVEHKSFTNLYKDELSQEGLPIAVVDVEQVPRTTVTIYPDGANKDLELLDLLIPRLSPGYRIQPELGELTFEELRTAFERDFGTLPLGEPQEREIKYEGRHLITDEVVERMSVKLELLKDGIGAVSFFREELEHAARIRGQHATLAPLVQRFLEEVLFKENVTLYDQRLIARLADADVREHMRATFIPLILAKITRKEERAKEQPPHSLSSWKPFQVTHSERRPAVEAKRTPFNLVPCNNELERSFANFSDFAADVDAFAKNTGPQALRIDYLNTEGRRTTYTPDFLVRNTKGHYYLVETKGRADRDVPAKARAAVEWCKAASTRKARWEYIYVPGELFEQVRRTSIDELKRACAPALVGLIRESESPQQVLPFDRSDEERVADQLRTFITETEFKQLPSRYRKALAARFIFIIKRRVSRSPRYFSRF